MLLQVALYIWDNGNGPHLTAVPELCTEPDDSPQSHSHCATSLSEPPLCVSICLNVIILTLPGGMVKRTKIKQQSKTEVIHSEAVATSVMIFNDLLGHMKAAASECYCFYMPWDTTVCINLKGQTFVLVNLI